MASSSPVTGALLVALAALAGLVLLSGGPSGCAHAGAARSKPPRSASAPARVAALLPGSLDPSEEITPEELASIPEPVPAATRAAAAAPVTPVPKASAEVVEPRSAGGEGFPAPATASSPSAPAPSSSPAPEPTPPAVGGPWIWRVQILATPDRALAERVAREAEERLGTTSRVDSEPPLHKVRLGGFGSEGDAQILKQRAVEMGYPGAFRVKIRVATTDE